MMSGTQGTPNQAFADEGYTKVFIVCGEGASSEKMPDLRASLFATGLIRAFQVSLPPASFYCELSDLDGQNVYEHTNFHFD